MLADAGRPPEKRGGKRRENGKWQCVRKRMFPSTRRKERCNEVWHDRDLLGVIPEGVVGDTISTGGGGAVFERARACFTKSAVALQFAASRFFHSNSQSWAPSSASQRFRLNTGFLKIFIKTVQRKGGWQQKS